MCAFALYGTEGFEAKRIFDQTSYHQSVMLFLEQDVAPQMGPGDVLMCDGASVNKHTETILVADRISHGQWAIVSPYSPHLSPIERGFALVWQYCRRREHQHKEPHALLLEAFEHYSNTGPEGYLGKF